MIVNLRKNPVVVATFSASGKQHREQILFCSTKHLLKIEAVPKKKSFLLNKMNNVVQWYDEFTGMNEVRRAQDRVLEEEENFKNVQKHRRSILLELTEIQKKIKEVYAEIDTTKRGEDRYIYLVTVENKLLKEEKVLLDKFSLAEKDERDSFAALSNSVKLSHERERAQAERTRYWSVLGSVVGTIIGIVGTSINNNFKMRDLKTIVQKSDVRLIENLKSILEENSNILGQSKMSEEKTNFPVNENYNTKIENLLNKINSRLSNVEEKLKVIEQNSTNNSGEASKMPLEVDALTITKNDRYTYIKTILFTFLALSVALPAINRIF